MSPEKKHRNRRRSNPASSAQGDGTEPDGEAAHDDPSVSSTDSEFEKILRNPMKQDLEDKRHIEQKLVSANWVILLQSTSNHRSHCRAWNCRPRKLSGKPNIQSSYRFNLKATSGRYAGGNLTPLVRSGQLKMDECFHQAIEDWFHYIGRTFDAQSYEHYNKVYKEWEDAWSVLDIEHQLQDHGDKSDECRQCGTIREEPRKSDYFPEQPSACSLGKVLASEAGVIHIDKLDVLEKRARARDMRKRRRVKGN
ncbi:hypothetical protein ACJ72_03762 [Emergomyces africanus]|uniref:Uncharacterized protein n=1 Tax=Emergomyces africanus TaxID=1955775 RepID=A0A1B7NYP7_9EURO|nr:hypothetical protein ACJ72_03762 [Emergomyces africanus]